MFGIERTDRAELTRAVFANAPLSGFGEIAAFTMGEKVGDEGEAVHMPLFEERT